MIMRFHLPCLNHARFLSLLFAALSLPTLLSPDARAASSAQPHWPQFRGPRGQAVAETQDVPVTFGPDQNLRWRVPTLRGNSSPCVWGDRIFLTGHANGELAMICVRASDGNVLWEKRRAIRDAPEYLHIAASPAMPTPCTDGTRVCFLFGDLGVIMTTMDGEVIWEQKLPLTPAGFGYGASPVLDEGALYLNLDGSLDSSLLCLDAATGATRWRADRKGAMTSYSTPYVLDSADAGTRQVLVAGSGKLEAVDAASGESVWHVNGLPALVCPSPVSKGGTVYFGAWTTMHSEGTSKLKSAFPDELELSPLELESAEALIARFDQNKDKRVARDELPDSRAKDVFRFVDRDNNGYWEANELGAFYDSGPNVPGRNVLVSVKAGGRGDVTDTRVQWEKIKGLPYVASPLQYLGRLYYVKSGGFITCLDSDSGQEHFEAERLGVGGEYYASPIGVGGKVIICSHRGTVFVLRAADTLEVLSRNNLGESIVATPAVADNTLYIRGENHLWAFGKR